MKTTGKFYATDRYHAAETECSTSVSRDNVRNVVIVRFYDRAQDKTLKIEMTTDEALNFGKSLTLMGSN